MANLTASNINAKEQEKPIPIPEIVWFPSGSDTSTITKELASAEGIKRQVDHFHSAYSR
jgi:hypothetical protein